MFPAARFLVRTRPVQTDDIGEQALCEAVLANHFNRLFAPQSCQFQPAIPHHMDEAVALHSPHCLRDRGARVPQALNNAGTQRRHSIFFELEDCLEIHFSGIDQVAHGFLHG